MDRLLSPFRQSRLLNTLFLSNIFISFHYALVVYVNSSFLNNFFSGTQVSALFIIGAAANTLLLLNASKILEKIGVHKFAFYVFLLELFAIVGMAADGSGFAVAVYFFIHMTAISLLLFTMDVFVESVGTAENRTGSIRATYLTLTNICVVISPAIVAFILAENTYAAVYLVSALSLLPLFHYIKRFGPLKEPKMKHIKVGETLADYERDKNLYNVFVSNFLLQLFYAYMVIYTPLYLIQKVGFSWYETGIMFTVMLLPFILFELPVGELGDEKYGEKEFMTIGFVVMGIATLVMSFLAIKNFWLWASILFVSRIGASFVEVTTESYFFKKVNADKTDVISFFRMTRPLAYLLAPLLATLSLQFLPFQYVFIVIGTIMVLGCRYSLNLKDTK